MFIENLLHKNGNPPNWTRLGRRSVEKWPDCILSLGKQSLLEQILSDTPSHEQKRPIAENWYSAVVTTAENLFALL
jgi:hypothetical protein